MARCPACKAEVDIDEFDVDRGDESSCPECGSNLVVMEVMPVVLVLAPDVPEDPAAWRRDDEEEQAKPFH